jgi:hypothetical protein
MAYEIDVASVTAVLLADGWHRVKGKSFGIEPYGFVTVPNGEPVEPEGKDAKEGKSRKAKASILPVVQAGVAPTMGARWTKPSGEVIACPLASVLALRHARSAQV